MFMHINFSYKCKIDYLILPNPTVEACRINMLANFVCRNPVIFDESENEKILHKTA